MAAYLVSKGNPFWTYSGGLGGIIAASAGNDLYHPIQAFVIGGVGVVFMYVIHHWVERRFKIDDAVGAIAVHGYAGFFGVVVAGFMLWGYPAADPMHGDYSLREVSIGMFTTEGGSPMINPLGNFIGAIIMFWVLGFLPCYVVARILKAFNMLRIPEKVELAGLDTHELGDAYPYHASQETEFESIERTYAKD
jgi:ammonia channel protein AmtB